MENTTVAQLFLASDENPSASIVHYGIITGGNGKIIEALTDKLDSHIHYNSPLRVISKTPDNKLQLAFDGHNNLITDYLILALPCSTLRDVSIEEKLLPEDQLHAIRSMQYGSNAKILLPIKSHKNMDPTFIMT